MHGAAAIDLGLAHRRRESLRWLCVIILNLPVCVEGRARRLHLGCIGSRIECVCVPKMASETTSDVTGLENCEPSSHEDVKSSDIDRALDRPESHGKRCACAACAAPDGSPTG